MVLFVVVSVSVFVIVVGIIIILIIIIIITQEVSILHRSEYRGWHKRPAQNKLTKQKSENSRNHNNIKCYPPCLTI